MQMTLPAASSRLAILAAVLATTTCCQSPAEAKAGSPGKPADRGAPAGLPTFLLPVPGGKTWIGLEKEQLMQACAEAVNPRDPGRAADTLMKIKLTNAASELGREQVEVTTFLLGKWPVKNREFKVFVDRMKAAGTPVNPPFHWWREGEEEHYNRKLKEINQLFPGTGKMGPIYYWDKYGKELPYSLKDRFGNDISEDPVALVSYRDAIKFAGWLGMRLPTELEWTRASRGDGEHIWPWAWRNDFEDHYVEDIKKHLGLDLAADIKRKPTGTTAFAQGPYGHFDMVGQVWEYTAGLGYRPISGQEAWADEWKKLQKDKVGALASVPMWADDKVIVKGGSYLSHEDPIQLHIDSRVGLPTTEILDGVGFRLAKSLEPGLDMLYSLVKSDYNQDLFLYGAQEVDLAKQRGLERYVLDTDGFPKEYHAVSFAPLNMLTDDKRERLNKLEERSQIAPLPIGTLSLTEKCVQPALEAGIYTVAWRGKGVPRELTDAMKRGSKDIKNALKRNKDKDEAEVLKEIEGDWKSKLTQFGLTLEDIKDGPVDFVRLGKLKIDTTKDMMVFYNNQGQWAAAAPGGGLSTAKELGLGVVTFDTQTFEKTEHARVTFAANLPLLKDGRKGAEYRVELILEQGPPAADEGWRLPPKE